MINKETLFILGAGASRTYNYPTGNELRTLIWKDLETLIGRFLPTRDREEKNYIRELSRQAKIFQNAFYESSVPSIDQFLNLRPEFEKIGKISIILSIYKSESESYFSDKLDSERIKMDWYTHLYKNLIDGLKDPKSYNEFKKNKINFITFNYDRSLEYFLSNSLLHSFKLDNEKLASLFENINFVHVYGQIAKLPWQKQESELSFNYKEPFFNKSPIVIEKLINNIYLIDERKNINTDIISKLISTADKIYILGFGFLAENMDILKIVTNTKQDKWIYATVYNFLDSEKEALQRAYFNESPIPGHTRFAIQSRTYLENANSLALLRKYPLE